MKRLVPLVVACGILACTKKADPAAPWLTAPDATTHARFFPISQGSTHGPAAGQQQVTTCNCCHADRSGAAQPAGSQCLYPPAASFTAYTCTGCHVAVGASGAYHDDIAGLATLPEHAGQAGFDPAQPLAFDKACRTCHPDGAAAAPAYHAQLFPIDGASTHAGIGCSSCHGTDRANLTQLQCASCHADSTKSPNFPTRHDPVGAVAILVQTTSAGGRCTTAALQTPANPVAANDDPRSCLDCHALSAPVPVSAHPTGDSTFGRREHQGAGCFTCHVATKQVTATVTPPATPPSGYPAVDFTQPSGTLDRTTTPGCITCHGPNGCVGP
jgi:hypothetical protein